MGDTKFLFIARSELRHYFFTEIRYLARTVIEKRDAVVTKNGSEMLTCNLRIGIGRGRLERHTELFQWLRCVIIIVKRHITKLSTELEL
jgi:hypothetical protein